MKTMPDFDRPTESMPQHASAYYAALGKKDQEIDRHISDFAQASAMSSSHATELRDMSEQATRQASAFALSRTIIAEFEEQHCLLLYPALVHL